MKFNSNNSVGLVDRIYDLSDNLFCFDLINKKVEFHREIVGFDEYHICFTLGDAFQSITIIPETFEETELLLHGFSLSFWNKDELYIKFQSWPSSAPQIIYSQEK